MSKKSEPASPGVKKRRKSGERVAFALYLQKVLKQVHPEKIGINAAALEVVNGLVVDVQDRVIKQAMKLAVMQKKKTLGAREVQTACAMLLPPEMSRVGISEGNKAVTKFVESK